MSRNWQGAIDLLNQMRGRNEDTYDQFSDIMRQFRRNELSIESVSERAHMLIGSHPDLWSKFVAFLPARLPPINLSSDAFGSVVKHLPLPSLARLSQTCRWAYAQITPAVFDAALQQARLTHGVFGVIRSETLRIKNANDETILVSPVAEGLSSLRVQINNRRYVAEIDDGAMASLLADIMASDEETRGRIRIWFRYEGRGDVIYIELFVSQDEQLVQQASAACILP